MKKKRVNPRRRPVTMAEVNRLIDEGVRDCVHSTKVIIFTVLLDKYGEDIPGLQEMWRKVDDLSDSVSEGRVSIADLSCVLREEYGILA